MTVLVGIKTENQVLIASDSLTTYGSVKLINTTNDHKIYSFPSFSIALSGEGPIAEVLELISLEGIWDEEVINTRLECSFLMRTFHDRFSDRVPEASNENLKYELLLGTKEKLFWCISEPSVFEIESYWSAGSGSDFALGALHVLYNQIDYAITIEEAARKAISAACEFNQDCQPPIDIRIL